MKDNHKENAKDLKISFSEAFEQIEKAADKAFSDMEEKSKKASQSTINSWKKIPEHQAEYDELLNQKKIRTLSDYEKKRLKILKNGIDFYKNLRDLEFNDIKTKLLLGEISNEEYYSALSILRDKYFATGSKEWNQYTLEIVKYNRDVISEQEKQIEEMLGGIEEKYSKSYSNILNKQNETRKKLDDDLKIYENVHFSMGEGKESEWLRLANIDEDLQILKNYNNSLISVKEKVNEIFGGMDMDEEKSSQMKSHFFEQITDMSVGKGTAFANHIINQPDDQLQVFIEKWVEKVDLAEAISKNLYADESEQLLKNYANDMSQAFGEALNEKFGEIPASFFVNGKKSALEFKEGFMSIVNDAVNGISAELSLKISELMPDLKVISQGDSVTNNSNYNIYGANSPTQTALEIFKEEEKRKMLVGG